MFLQGQFCASLVNPRMSRDNLSEQFVWLVQRLLDVLSGLAVFGNPERASRFRAELEVYRREVTDPLACESIDATARKCLALCQDYFQHVRTHQFRNETEYGSIIDILRQAIATLTAGTSLQSTVLGSVQRFRELVKLDDIEVLRKKIVQEVHLLEAAMEEKKRESEQFVELLSSRLEFIENKLCDTQLRLKKTETETSVDALTGIANRRHFDRQLDMWVASRNIGPFVLAMIDVDNFKKVNDQYGHQTGDRVLIDVARIMRR